MLKFSLFFGSSIGEIVSKNWSKSVKTLKNTIGEATKAITTIRLTITKSEPRVTDMYSISLKSLFANLFVYFEQITVINNRKYAVR
jgi:hypothetical protein